jgi:SNF2 family DNA or RNA helicase/uncharacterized Zn finger protein
MSKYFGNTWWGEHWLKSLDNIDYENRLPRGASYARSGKVKSITIKDNLISAKVAGSRPSPYKVTILVPPFFPEDIDILIDEIISRPALISKLLNRELDPSILQIAEKIGLKVFPNKWTDFKMYCNCPDWAVPCKHLASVIYTISREIDNNPFMVFQIHNVKLLDELKKRNIFIDKKNNTIVPQYKETLKTLNKTDVKDFNEEDAYKRIDFTQLQPIAEPLIQLLPANPPFYNGGDFREKYAATLHRLVKDAIKILKGNTPLQSFFGDVKRKDADNMQPLTYRNDIKLLVDDNAKLHIIDKENKELDFSRFIMSLWAINPDHLLDYQPSVASIHTSLIAALQLISKGAVVPQIFQLENKDYSIQWQAAIIDKHVKEVITKLDDSLPSSLLQTTKLFRKKIQTFPIGNQAHILISLLLTEIISKITFNNGFDAFQMLFFSNKTYPFSGVGESALSGGIKIWLERYFLSTEQYKPVITVNELYDENFIIDVSIEDSEDKESLFLSLETILTQKQYEKKRFAILQTLSLLSPFITRLDTYINENGKYSIEYDKNEFIPFLFNMLPAIRLLDIKTLLPKSLQEILSPKSSLKVSLKSKDEGSFIRLDDLFQFDWQVAIGDEVMSPEEFRKFMRNASGLMKFKERYIFVSEADMEKIYKSLTNQKTISSYRLLQYALMEEYEGAPIILSQEVKNMIDEFNRNISIDLPEGLNATLRAYQHNGYSWLYRNMKIGFGSIIADDMGLGKTVQVIAIIQKLKEEGAVNKKQKVLVVVPTGLLTNWQLEIEKFTTTLTSFIYHGTNRNLEQFESDVLITSYGVVRSDFEILKKIKWAMLIIDEAQNIKNNETAQCKAVKSISAQIRIAMSGTPVENRLSEFWSIMDFSNKNYLGNLKSFKEEFATPIQVFNDEKAVGRFKKITSPFMLRRLKTDKSIISDLPDKIEQNQFSVLTKQQATLYNKTLNMAMQEIEQIKGKDHQTLFKRQGLVLQMILALKQICNHPTQFLKNGKLDATLSGKTLMLLDMLDSILDSNEKVLIFSQFKEMGLLLEHFIKERFGEKPMFYHGGCNVKQRQQMVERFQNNRADKIFLLSLKAAGTGLNLTAATQVIHYDLWWNPAVEAQATDRAYRIGQTKNVQVHRYITKNTFEERIDEMIQKKKNLAEMTVSTGENWIGKLSNNELREIFRN